MKAEFNKETVTQTSEVIIQG